MWKEVSDFFRLKARNEEHKSETLPVPFVPAPATSCADLVKAK